MTPVFEVVLDHNDPQHEDQLDRATRDLYAWARRHQCMQLIREEQEIRPGVVKLRFLPNRAPRPRVPADRLVLSGRRA